MLDFNLNCTLAEFKGAENISADEDGDEVIFEYRTREDRDIDFGSLYSELLDGFTAGLDLFASCGYDHTWTPKWFDRFDQLVTEDLKGSSLDETSRVKPDEDVDPDTLWRLIPSQNREKLQAAFVKVKVAAAEIALTFDFAG